MTSKEAVLELICEAKSADIDGGRVCFLRNIIEKDLEVLEMLKKKMTIETDYYDSDDDCEEYEYIAYNGTTLNIDTPEEFDLLREVLCNDK